MDFSRFAFSKPGNQKRSSFRRERATWGWKYADGREVCNLKSKAGKAEYYFRIGCMWARQQGVCCICKGAKGPLMMAEATFEHEEGRGSGGSRRDDRIWKDGKHYNGAAHPMCNMEKGSKRMDVNA